MHPEQLYKLTPREIQTQHLQYAQDRNREVDLLAWTASNIMNVHLKKQIKHTDLYKSPEEDDLEEYSDEAFNSFWEKREALRQQRAAEDLEADEVIP